MGQVISLHGYSAEIVDRLATVLDVQVWSETRVSGRSHGGGGFVGQSGGYVGAPSVTIGSNVTSRNRVFLKFDDGAEEVRDLTDQYPMRPGHRVLCRYLSFLGRTQQVFYRNLNTGQEWRADDIIVMPKLSMRFFKPFVWTSAIAFALIYGIGFVVVMMSNETQIVAPLRTVIAVAAVALFIGLIAGTISAFMRGPSQEQREADEFAVEVRRAVVA